MVATLLTVRATAPGVYEIRRCGRSSPASDHTIAARDLSQYLCADGADPSELVHLYFVAGEEIESLLATQRPAPKSIGWESLMLPQSPHERRRISPMSKATFSIGISGANPGWLAECHPSAASHLARPELARDDCVLISVDGRQVGWVPVQRISTSTSIIRQTLIEAHVFADEPRRLSHLRLSAWSAAVHHQFDMERTVVSWLPDDGDEINVYKKQISQADMSQQWFYVQARRDLAPVL
jgi:hypothetical protein